MLIIMDGKYRFIIRDVKYKLREWLDKFRVNLG